jgi:two-component sensor histidine kinase
MALVHEQLYQSTDLAHIQAAGYVQQLGNQLLRSFQSATAAVHVRFAIDDIRLDIDRAIPLGLIVNELVSNSLKHAFPNNLAGEIWVTLHGDSTGALTLTVGDSGIGMPPSLDMIHTESLGLQLVQALAQQVSGDLCWEHGAGTIATLTIPERTAGHAS